MTTTGRYPIYYVEGDTGPDLAVTYEPGSISGWTIVLRVRREDGLQLADKSAVIDDASAGEFHFTWDAGDLVRGTHSGEIHFDPGGGDPTFTVPNDELLSIIVRGDLDKTT